jgi:hypothetical protein
MLILSVAVINTTGVHFDLLLMDLDHNELRCIVSLAAPENAGASIRSFYDQKCRDNDWSISWGYRPGQDTAIMTVVK